MGKKRKAPSDELCVLSCDEKTEEDPDSYSELLLVSIKRMQRIATENANRAAECRLAAKMILERRDPLTTGMTDVEVAHAAAHEFDNEHGFKKYHLMALED